VGEKNPNLIKRVMDAGAYGVIVPMINTKGQAEAAVKAVKYPPIGNRGVGLARAQGYGQNFDEYASTVNEESVVIVQVEHIESVRNLESILLVDGVDGCIIGPYDLSASLGVPGKFENAEVINAIAEVEKICKYKKVPLGFHIIQPDFKEVLEKASRGYTFLGLSLDILFLGNSCKEQINFFRENI
jgi:2-dehydro-3-deoxyglucarate aldolase